MTEFEMAVVPLSDVPFEVYSQDWVMQSALLAPSRFRRLSVNASWHSWAIIARRHQLVAGIMLVQQAKHATVSEIFNPSAVAPKIFGTANQDPRSYLLLGGVTDLVAGTAISVHLAPPAAQQARHALLTRSMAEAERRGLNAAALYVRAEELPAFTRVGFNRTQQIGQLSTIHCPIDDNHYLAALSRSQRRTVRKDRRMIADSGLRTEIRPAGQVADVAAEYVVHVKQRHGVPDHPRLARLRLSEWAEEPLGERIAFMVSDHRGPLAITFACRTADRLEIYEAGLIEHSPHRHLAYVESLVYAPVRYGIDHGVSEIILGLDAETPKTIRGATLSPVWAVGQRDALSPPHSLSAPG